MRRWLLCAVALVAVTAPVVAAAGRANASAVTASDPLAGRQYHLQTVRAPAAWAVTRGAGAVVAVVDTGVDRGHPDLRGRVLKGIDLVEPGTSAQDENGHGTLVAGVVAATAGNDEGGAGVAPHVRLLPVRVLDEDGRGTAGVVASGIDWAVRNGADVVNLSLADVPGRRRRATSLITGAVTDAIRRAELSNVLVVAAAGNGGRTRSPYGPDVPAVVVGATGPNDTVWQDSNRDPQALYAPGVGIVSTYSGGGYAVADGTSFATPVVAAGAALLRAQGFSADMARRQLHATATPIGPGIRRLDIAAAVGRRPPRDLGDQVVQQDGETPSGQSGAVSAAPGDGEQAAAPGNRAESAAPAGPSPVRGALAAVPAAFTESSTARWLIGLATLLLLVNVIGLTLWFSSRQLQRYDERR